MGYAVTPIIAKNLADAIAEFGGDGVIRAIGIASASNVRTWSYVRGIFERVRTSGWLDKSPRSNGTNGHAARHSQVTFADDEIGGFYG
jgi:hypothetical protein